MASSVSTGPLDWPQARKPDIHPDTAKKQYFWRRVTVFEAMERIFCDRFTDSDSRKVGKLCVAQGVIICEEKLPKLCHRSNVELGQLGKVLLLTFALFSSLRNTSAARTSSSKTLHHTVKCYSCMSKHYESLFDKFLSSIYHRPKNFSQDCDHNQIRGQRGIGLVTCPSICITMTEKTFVAGIPVMGYIRGCYDTMLLRGFNQTLVRWYRWLQRDSCHQYPKKEVLQLPFHSQGHIQICTCYSDGCNGSPRLSGAPKNWTILWYLWPSLIVAVSSAYSDTLAQIT